MTTEKSFEGNVDDAHVYSLSPRCMVKKRMQQKNVDISGFSLDQDVPSDRFNNTIAGYLSVD